MENEVLLGDCKDTLKRYPAETFDCIVTDPPYGYKFMNVSWDKSLPSVEALKECCRVLKSGAFAFFMCAPRQDVLSRMIIRLEDAGFQTGFTSIYWAYATGFPKATDVGKLIDKRNGRDQESYKPFAEYLKQKRQEKHLSMSEIDHRLGTNTAYSWWEGRANVVQLPTMFYYFQLKEILGLDSRFDELIGREEAEREVIGKAKYMTLKDAPLPGIDCSKGNRILRDITSPSTEKAKQFDGSFAGFQPKPSVEIIIVCMKPLHKTDKNKIKLDFIQLREMKRLMCVGEADA